MNWVRPLVACWNMPWLVVLSGWSTQRERVRGGTEKEKRLVVNWNLVWSDPAAPCRFGWMEELRRRLIPWWVWIIASDFNVRTYFNNMVHFCCIQSQLIVEHFIFYTIRKSKRAGSKASDRLNQGCELFKYQWLILKWQLPALWKCLHN